MAVKIFLAEDHDIVRHGIKALLSAEQSVVVAGEASNGAEVLAMLKTQKPDVVVMDMNMPVTNGLETTKLIKKEYPDVKVLILSMHDHESYLIDLLDAGADGYVLKNSTKEELLFAILKIADGGMYIAPEFTMNMLAKYRMSMTMSSKTDVSNVHLTEREQDVLELIADGFTNLEIANKLFTSVRTIETRRKKLLEKTGTVNTATLIRFAVKHGLIQ